MNDRATFVRMDQSTQEDWRAIGGEFMHFAKGLPERVLVHLKLLDGDFGGFPIDRYHHSLQTATLALRDGRDEKGCGSLDEEGLLHADSFAWRMKYNIRGLS